MNFESEISLLIKSKYSLVLVDTIDEDFVARQLFSVAAGMGLCVYCWSLTKGLRVGKNENSFYKTGSPANMLKVVNDLVGDKAPALFIFSDFHKFLQDAVVARLFKDILAMINNTSTTIVIIGADQPLPPDIEPCAARITGGYPDEKEIMAEINRTVAEFRRSSLKLNIALEPEDVRRMVKSLKGLSIQQIRNVLNTAILKDGTLDKKDLTVVEKYKKGLFDREGVLEYFGAEQPANIAGFSNLKKWVCERKTAFFADDSPLPPPKGLLLLGVQGCGKSLAAKMIAGELGIPLYRLDLNRLYSKYIGETEENLRKALKTIERLAPVCLWIDEIEKIFASSSGEMDGGVSKRVLGSMLTWMQERKDRAFIAATSNDINNLPPELLRKGRFDEIFFTDLPQVLERAEIFRIHILKRNLAPERFDLDLLARGCEGFSGAEIEQAVISALYSASGSNEPISARHILEQLKLTRPLSVIKAEAINYLRDWAKERRILPV
ncbi:MAG: AAA family ATPase [Elusimicrobia bacterium]|nr:AAA family ATPase [Elusimicrobiota bacterium]